MSSAGGATGAAAATGAAPGTGTFDLRPIFAPRSVAIVGASPRGDLATTIRDTLDPQIPGQVLEV